VAAAEGGAAVEMPAQVAMAVVGPAAAGSQSWAVQQYSSEGSSRWRQQQWCSCWSLVHGNGGPAHAAVLLCGLLTALNVHDHAGYLSEHVSTRSPHICIPATSCHLHCCE
jgi:hypothetical protein